MNRKLNCNVCSKKYYSDELSCCYCIERDFKKWKKEFVRIDTELINQFACGQITLLELKQKREKLAGEI